MVKALHRAGIEVILDVVFNHTAEGERRRARRCAIAGWPTSFYYILEDDRSRVCGLHRLRQHAQRQPADRPPPDRRQPALLGEGDARGRLPLRPRSILSRDEAGVRWHNPPVLWDIESDPVLAGTKLIAEAWDAAGLYQVGSFVGDSWQEWNGRFRDDVRSFLKGDRGTVGRLAAAAARQPRHLRARGARSRSRASTS